MAFNKLILKQMDQKIEQNNNLSNLQGVKETTHYIHNINFLILKCSTFYLFFKNQSPFLKGWGYANKKHLTLKFIRTKNALSKMQIQVSLYC